MTSMNALKSEFDSVAPPEQQGVRRPYRSYKKKYLKMRYAFRKKIIKNATLDDQESRATVIAQRLQEQNDQLLELLLDINDSKRIPPGFRYDLRSPPPSETTVPDLMVDDSTPSYKETQMANTALQELRSELQSGRLDSESYREQEAALTSLIIAGQSLASLSSMSHSTLDIVPSDLLPIDLTEDMPLGYLSLAHEEDYINRMESYLDTAQSEDFPIIPKAAQPSERERERNAQTRNPVSVFNWFSQNKPKVFLDDDGANERPSRAARKPSPKAASATPVAARPHTKREKPVSGSLSREEDEILDDEGYVIGGVGEGLNASMKKRKRGQDDDAYRPKGGGSKKRKRASLRNSFNVAAGDASPGGEHDTAEG